jgi:hypothetical protein
MRMKTGWVIAALLMTVLAQGAAAEKKPVLVKPLAGPRATALRITMLYVAPDKQSEKVDRVQIGRELVIAEKSGPWIRVYANTDIKQIQEQRDAPILTEEGDNQPPVSGWMESKGIVVEATPDGDRILMGEAANQEALAQDPRGPVNAARSARLLYRRLVEMYPNSPLVAEASWRTADIQWQIDKAEQRTRPSSHEREAYLREPIEDEELKKVIKLYPHTRQADLAAFDLIDNKLCGDWQGEAKCPEKESDLYEKYAAEHPDSPRAAQALYLAVYRQAVLTDMYAADEKQKRSEAAHAHAKELANQLKEHFPASDYSCRAGALVYKLDEGIPVYGLDRE